MEDNVRKEKSKQTDNQIALLFSCWRKEVEKENEERQDNSITFNHELHSNAQSTIMLDGHGDGPEIFDHFFPEPSIVLITIDGHRIGVNHAMLADQLLAFCFNHTSLNRNAIEVPIAYEPLVILVSAMHKKKPVDVLRLFQKCTFSLLFGVFDAAVQLGLSLFVNGLVEVIFERSEPSTYVVAMQKLSSECPLLAQKLWKLIVSTFYRFKFDPSVGLIENEQMKSLLFDEPLNVLRGDEMVIFRQWKQIVHPNGSIEVDQIEEQLTEMLVGSVQDETRTRSPFSVLLALGGWSFNGPSTGIEVFDGYRAQWIVNNNYLTELPEARCYFAAIPMLEQNSVVVLGGMDGNRYYDSSISFDLNSMSNMCLMNESRCYVNATALDGSHILATGGYDRMGRHKNAEVFHFGPNIWTTISPMNFVRSDGAAIELNKKVYVIGGFNGRTCLRTVEYYDPNQDRWFVLEKEMREKRSGVGGLSIHGVLMVTGGFNGRNRLSSVEFYDPREGQWHFAESMKLNRSNFGFSQLRDDPMVVGGYDGHSTTELVEFFDWRANKWFSGPPLQSRRSALSLFRLDDFRR
ncbi:BACK domain-containing protein [Aphelenchoides besseyi]|nr:BACK domain-containing protein [Aphelenchoides besseyi]KAI6193419.1 BACK domain-containing protein [Aphelenchoides besseyi]